LAAQDSDLVAQHDDLDDQVLLPTASEPEQLKEPNEANVEERERHARSSALLSHHESPGLRACMTFSAPTGAVAGETRKPVRDGSFSAVN
jgi:hypothetical protein